ncbi:FtsX-like permease family protein [Streptomyces sp. NPDC006326]|uniref:FtsX-like permease family protein n=1 Tax=Streptomyces sp. NPDC006326 TaxID=3156752 RepID=UPI0033B4FB95
MLGFVARRLRGRLPLAAVVLLTVLITTTALTALLAFTRVVPDAGLRQALQGPGHARTTVVVTGEHAAGTRAKDDEAVRAFATRLFGRLPVAVESVARSRSYGLPGAHAPGKDADLTLLAALDRSRTRLLAGRWPQPAADPSAPVQAAAPQALLTRLGLVADALPAEIRLDDRYGGAPLTVQVTGVYRAADPGSPYWRLDPIGGREVQVSGFTTYGPLLTEDSAFTGGALPQNSRAGLLTADFSAARPADVQAVRAAAAGLRATGPDADAAAGPLEAAGIKAATELPELLGELESAQRVARSTLLVGALQLAVLAAAALLLVAYLMAERKEAERILLTARGASRRRLALLTGFESLLLALPAAVLAPLLTPPLLGLLTRSGPAAKPAPDTSASPLTWALAGCCALGCVLLTALPAVLRGAAAAALRRTGARQAVVAGVVRSGGDLALVALAVLAYAQLVRYGADGSRAAAGAGWFGVDPVLVAAPTLALCAGTVLVLRVLPFAARLGSRMAARGRGLGPALTGWQLARRPRQATGPVLLLVLAVSSGVLALGQHRAWTGSQRDQAEFATAGGLRIVGGDLSPLGRGGRYASLPGGDRVIPVVRHDHSLPGGGAATVLALDAPAVAQRVPLRPDLRDGRSMQEVFGPLTAPAPGAAAGPATSASPANPAGPAAAASPAGPTGVALPARTQRVDLDVSVTAPVEAGRPRLGLLLRDRFGLTYRTPAAPLPVNGGGTASFDLAGLADAPVGSAAAPLEIGGIVLSFTAPAPQYGDAQRPPRVDAELTVRGIAVAQGADGPAAALPAPAPAWHLAGPEPAKGGVEGAPSTGELRSSDGALLRLHYRSSDYGDLQVPVTAGAPPAAEVPALATRAYLAGIGSAVGDVVSVPLGFDTVRVRITGAVESLPAAGGAALAVDLRTLGHRLAADGGTALPAATEWWLPAASAGDPAPSLAAAELRSGAGGTQQVQLREQVLARLLDDPLSAGPQAALAALALACAVLAGIGFAASAAANTQERAGEFAVLLALGAPRRDLARTAAAGSGVLVVLATAVGIGLGAAIVHLTVPLMVLTSGGHRPVPAVVVDLPAGETVLLAACIAAVPLLSALFGGRRSRNASSAAARLRSVEEM